MKHGLFIFLLIIVAGLSNSPALAGKPVVAASTSILGDVVKQVAGDAVELLVMIPPGTDPHHFDPSARQLADYSQASIIFINGLGLETYMERFLSGITTESQNPSRVIVVSSGITPRGTDQRLVGDPDDHDHHSEYDPHVWTDPLNILIWVDNITSALSDLLPGQAATFQLNAENYKMKLRALDTWISESVAVLPETHRIFVSDHDMLGYFCARYNFTQSGLILPGYSTAAEPSARGLSGLNKMIGEQNIRVLLLGMSANSTMADRLAADTKIRVVKIYSEGLGTPGSGADTYLDFMKFNVHAILDALK